MKTLTQKQAAAVIESGLTFEFADNGENVVIENAAIYRLTPETEKLLKRPRLSILIDDSLSQLRALGLVFITDIGGENVYLKKDGKSYYTKLLNTGKFKPGFIDFSTLAD